MVADRAEERELPTGALERYQATFPTDGIETGSRIMYAIIETGGKQYRVHPGDIIDIERLPENESDQVVFDRVLMVGGDEVKIGTPVVEGAQVHGERLADVRGPKITVFKVKRRKGYRRKNGHRQDLLRVRIKDIQA